LKPDTEPKKERKGKKQPVRKDAPVVEDRKDEPAEGAPNGEPDGDARPSAYYEDYDEDAEPEEKE
jgi:hypothetical protein